jgi:hypothetical protein
MDKRTRLVMAGGTLLLVVAAGTGIAAGNSDADTPITGDAYDKAVGAALDYTGGGVVQETEVGDEESMYEVEIRLPDGTQIDVQLDENFVVVSEEVDDDDVDDKD